MSARTQPPRSGRARRGGDLAQPALQEPEDGLLVAVEPREPRARLDQPEPAPGRPFQGGSREVGAQDLRVHVAFAADRRGVAEFPRDRLDGARDVALALALLLARAELR